MSNLKCQQCGMVNFADATQCKKCGMPLNQEPNTSTTEPTPEDKNYSSYPDAANSTPIPANSLVSTMQGFIIIGLLCTVVVFLALNYFKPKPAYDYKVVFIPGENKSRTGTDALEATSIQFAGNDMTALGDEGWELVDVFLENETAYPNFGNSDYVTGLQPNVRPRRAVLLFKRQIR